MPGMSCRTFPLPPDNTVSRSFRVMDTRRRLPAGRLPRLWPQCPADTRPPQADDRLYPRPFVQARLAARQNRFRRFPFGDMVFETPAEKPRAARNEALRAANPAYDAAMNFVKGSTGHLRKPEEHVAQPENIPRRSNAGTCCGWNRELGRVRSAQTRESGIIRALMDLGLGLGLRHLRARPGGDHESRLVRRPRSGHLPPPHPRCRRDQGA